MKKHQEQKQNRQGLSIKRLATILAMAMLTTFFINNFTLVVSALPVEKFTVNLPTGVSGTIQVTLTNAEDTGDTSTMVASDGQAVFEAFVDDGNEYDLTVSGIDGYDTFTIEAIPIVADSDSITIDINDLVPIFEVTGRLTVDDEGTGYSGDVTITLSTPGRADMQFFHTLTDGEYTASLVSGKTYTINIDPNADEYETLTIDDVVITSDLNIGEHTLSRKTFAITTEAGANGSIILDPDSTSVSYGDDVSVTIRADNGYTISSLTVDGATLLGPYLLSQAVGGLEYSFTLDDIRTGHNIQATFDEITDGVFSEFRVNLKEDDPDGSGEHPPIANLGPNVKVTITDVANPNYTRTVDYVDDEAVFYNIVKINHDYKFKVTGMIGVLDFDQNIPVHFNQGIDFHYIHRHEFVNRGLVLPKKDIYFAFKTLDGTDQRVSGSYSISGYEDRESTDIDNLSGVGIENLYMGQAYTVSFDVGEKYEPCEKNITVSDSINYEEVLLTVNTYTLTKENLTGGGRIWFDGQEEDSEADITVEHGSDINVNIDPDQYWQVDEVSITNETTGTSYSIALDNNAKLNGFYHPLDSENGIRDNYTVTVKFMPIIKTVTFNFDESLADVIEIEPADDAGITALPDGKSFEVRQGSTPSFTVKIKADKSEYHLTTIKRGGNNVLNNTSNDCHEYVIDVGTVINNISYNVNAALDEYDVSIYKYVDEQLPSPTPTPESYEHGSEIDTIEPPDDDLFADSNAFVSVYNSDYELLYNLTTDDDGNLSAPIIVKSDLIIEIRFSSAIEYDGDPTGLFSLIPNEYTEFIELRTNGTVNEYVYSNSNEAAVTFAPFGQNPGSLIRLPDQEDSQQSHNFDVSTYVPFFYVRLDADSVWYIETNYPFRVIIDKQSPEVRTVSAPDWASGVSVVNGTASDPDNQDQPSSGLWKMVWSVDSLSDAEVIDAAKNGPNSEDIDSDGNFSFSISGQQNEVYNVYAVDLSQNVSESMRVNVKIDDTLPAVDGFYVSKVHDDQIVRELPFGTYSNKEVQLRVAASDEGGSGLASISLYLNNELIETKSVTDNNDASFIVPAEFFAEQSAREITVTATAKDVAGNEMALPVFPDNSDDSFAVNKLILENIKPGATIVPNGSIYIDPTGKTWYSESPTFSIGLSDADSGINRVTVTVNGTAVNTDIDGNDFNLRSNEAETSEQTIVIFGDPSLRRPDGTYEIVVRVEDNSGNIAEETIIVYQDIGDPYIRGFRYEVVGTEGVSAMPAQIESTEYGYYFSEDTVVTILAGDSAPSAGVKSITYFTVDHNNTKSAETTILTTNDEVSFIVPANFKGKIYAKATDAVGNTPDLFTSPMGTIVESLSKHLEETHITIDKPQTTLRDDKGLDLYANDIDVNLTVIDTYSGIYKVEWSVVAPNDVGNNQSGQVEVNNDASLAGGDSSGWSVRGTNENLVTEMTRTLRITNNSNTILLRVRITDRAGNVTEKDMTFSIDKTSPTIQVSYNNNSPDSQFTDYYNADRTATIVITERNFSPDNVPVTITGTGVSTPSVSSWTTVTDLTNPDKTTHTATVHYSADGDYTFNIAYSDLAGNRANIFTQQSFTIDKTKPVVSVSYDNDSAQNGKYYQAMRTATIRIVDRNFEPSRIKIEGIATDNGVSVTFPVTSGWSSSGDTHTTTVRFSAEATYRFSISGLDRAGNSLDVYQQSEFIIDTTAPTLEITGVENRSANNGVVIPVLSMADANYDPSKVSITLVGANSGEVVPSGESEEQTDGEIFTFDDFERIKEVDDIYTLKVSVVDYAGNETTQQIEFSVNRFGSVYTFDDLMKTINGKYLLSEPDIILHETNVDTLLLDTIKIKITVNGVPRDLVEGADYSVQVSGGDGEWSRYTYTINKELFAGDGLYSVSLYSVDRAGNVNENIDEVKAAEINFGVDKTRPVVVSVDLDSNKQYPVEEKSATFSVKDNLELASVRVYLNGEEVELQTDGENYTFVVAQSNAPQSIKVIAVDSAGNEQFLELENFLVTTNLFFRWVNNTPVFVGSILGVAGLATGISLFFVFLRRKRRRRA